MVSINLRDYSKYIFLIIIILLLYASYKIIAPLIPALLSAIILTIVLHPIYMKIYKKTKRKNLSSLAIIFLIIIFIIIPLIFITNALFQETINIFNAVSGLELNSVSETLKEATGLNINFERHIRETLQETSSLFLSSTSKVIEFLIQGFVEILIMFFLIFLLLTRGDKIMENVKRVFPMRREDKTRLFKEINNIIRGLFKGLFFVAIIEGIVSWIGFSLFGVPNPLIWALIIAIFAMIPVVGPILIWVPASIYLFSNGQTTMAIGLFIYSAIFITYIDTFLKPILIGKRSKIDPVIILLGIVGGIKLLGLVGIIIGPLTLSILVVIYRMYGEKDVSAS